MGKAYITIIALDGEFCFVFFVFFLLENTSTYIVDAKARTDFRNKPYYY